MDVIFDAVGGRSVKKGFRSLTAGGRIVCYGASDMTNKNLWGKLKSAIGFGFYHPVMLMMPSKTMIGVNMLSVADQHPEVLQRCLTEVVKLTATGVFTPNIGKVFQASEIAAASTNLSGTIPGVATFLSANINNTTAANYYLLVLGDANGTGHN